MYNNATFVTKAHEDIAEKMYIELKNFLNN